MSPFGRRGPIRLSNGVIINCVTCSVRHPDAAASGDETAMKPTYVRARAVPLLRHVRQDLLHRGVGPKRRNLCGRSPRDRRPAPTVVTSNDQNPNPLVFVFMRPMALSHITYKVDPSSPKQQLPVFTPVASVPMCLPSGVKISRPPGPVAQRLPSHRLFRPSGPSGECGPRQWRSDCLVSLPFVVSQR